MIVKITRGAKVAGLMSYLVGPGKTNEHTDPHLVAGDSAIMAWHDDTELSAVAARDIAKQIDQPRRVFGTEVKIANFMRDDEGREVRDAFGKKIHDPIDPYRDANTWHCSLSLRADEGPLTDDQWGQIAGEFMDRMGFTDESGHSPARWVAVRHGVSANGNDHIHIAASLVREDGTKVNVYRDYKRASEAAHDLEVKHGLAVIDSRAANVGEPGYTRAEAHRARRQGLPTNDRDELARRVRAAATASKSEAEFVRRLRGQGLIVRPRMAAGTTDVVTGFKVALRPESGSPVFFGGGHLGKDLTLPRLRHEWEDTPEAAGEAAAEWNAARRDHKAVRSGGRETKPIDPKLLERASQDIAQWNKYLAAIPVNDRQQWARAAGRTAGVYAAWSARTESTPGPLAAAARQLARSAQLPAHQHWKASKGSLSAGGAALIVMQASAHLPKSAAYALLMRQLAKTIEAIAASHRASGELHRARELEAVAHRNLELVHAASASTSAREDVRRHVSLDFPVAATEAVRKPSTPLPNKLEPRKQSSASPRREEGLER